MNSEPDEQLDRIKSQIRADADAARQRAPLPQRTAATGGSGDAGVVGQRASINELGAHAGPAFVDHAYRTILRRAPDSEGFARQMATLGAGAGKIEVIGDLRYSAEGRRHATHIPGLLPRYLLAKVGRVPVLGALVQWLVAVASLPHLLRHQRATEASLAVRFGETAAALQAAQHRDAELREAIDALRSDLASAVDELSARLTVTEESARAMLHRIEILELPDPEVIELRQMTFSMNHWTAQVRKSIDAIEATEAERRARNDETSAAIVLRERALDAERAERLGAWATELARHMPPGAAVVDLCGGSDWLDALTARGWNASSIETNSALHRDARARDANVTLGSPAILLARIADGSLDALTIVAPERIAEDMPLAELLREAHRLLKRGGSFLIGMMPGGSRAESVSVQTLLAAGFADAKTLDAFGATAVLAVRP